MPRLGYKGVTCFTALCWKTIQPCPALARRSGTRIFIGLSNDRFSFFFTSNDARR